MLALPAGRRVGTVGGMRRLLVLAVAALLLAACGSSPSGTQGSTSSSAATGTTEAASGSGATAAVRQAYETLFDLASPALDAKVAVVQDGAALRSTLQHELSSPLAKLAAGATVSAVAVQSAATCSGDGLPSPCATVAYDILSTSHKPLFPTASTGYAVYTAGRWLVAKETICGLLALAGGSGTPAGC